MAESNILVNKIKQKRRNADFNRLMDAWLITVVPVVLIIIWQFFSNWGYINVSILPSPGTIWDTFYGMVKSGEIFQHLSISLLRVMKGYVLGSVLGISLGTLIGLVRRLDKALVVIIGLFRPIPVIAWVPMLILWLGIDEASKVTVITIGSFWPILLNTIHGIKNTDKKYLEVAKTLEKSTTRILFKVVLPSALPSIFTGLRIGIGNAWMSVVGAELIAAASGIGYLISYARELSQPDVMLVGVCSIGVVGLLIDTLLKVLEKKLLRWNVNIQG